MAAQISLPGTPALLNLSPNIVLHDIGKVLATTSQFLELRQGSLFISTPLYLATHADHDFLREELKTRTIISTLHPKEPRYVQGPVPGSYVVEQYVTEDFLGLRACHLHLRHGGDFIRNTISELPLASRLNFQYDVKATNNAMSPDLVRKVQDLVWNRDSIDESLTILTSSASIIGCLFNDVFCEAKSYPLIISGDFMLRDSGLVMFLILLLLDIPLSTIGHAYVRIASDFAARSKETGIQDSPVNDARAANREHWAKELSHRLEARFGSTSAYFDLAGVSSATRTRIKDIFLISDEKTLVDIF